MTHTYFISGHLNLTQDEFNAYYKHHIDTALFYEGHFVVGDAKGADLLAQQYLIEKTQNVTVYHMLQTPRNNVGFCDTLGGYITDEARDEAMTYASDFDILWVRPGREKSGTAANLLRRNKVAPKFFPRPDWENDGQFIFLGLDRNPHTKRKYDFWLHKWDNNPCSWSPTARHGLEASEYGSGPLSVTHRDRSHFGEDFKKDFVWGMERADTLALYYLATGCRPALMSKEEFEIYYGT